jgi:BCD family chlorophyll transporter-like MFS transporter
VCIDGDPTEDDEVQVEGTKEFSPGWMVCCALGKALAMPATGYGVVYALELSLLFVTLIAIGPLVGRGTVVPLSERKFGLAELPG